MQQHRLPRTASSGLVNCIGSKQNCAALIRRLALSDGRNDQHQWSPTCILGSSITVPVSRQKSPLVEALAYIAKYWDGLKLFMADGRIEIDNNSVERTIRPIALNRKNALFAGHDAGAENWATIASLIETCKLNAVDPQAYLTATLTAIVNGHKQSRIDELLPWNYPLE